MSPLFIVLATIFSILLYIVVFLLLGQLFYHLADRYKKSKGGLALIYWILAAIVGVVFFTLDFIHTIACIILGIQVASSFRDWWQKGGM